MCKNILTLRGYGISDESIFRHKSKNFKGRSSSDRIWLFDICERSFVPAKGYIEILPTKSKQMLLCIVLKVFLTVHFDE